MGLIQAFTHVINLFMPALLLGAISAGLAKLAWRHELAAVPWWRLAAWAAAGASLVTLAGLVAFGQDGRIATYAGMVVAAAAALWACGFGPGRS